MVSTKSTSEGSNDPCLAAMERVQAGDSQAFRIVYEETVDEIHRFIARRVSKDDADDLVADTFVRAFRNAESWKQQGRPVIAWLMTIARNVVKNHVSKAGRRAGLQPHLADERTQLSQEDLVLDADDIDRILDCLHRLSDKDRRILELRFVQGLSAPQVGEIVGASEGAVRTSTYRALKSLRTDFVREGGEMT